MKLSRLVIASNNKKKRAEIERILNALNIAVVPAEDTVFVDVVEDGDTFAENAKKKADAFMVANNLPALADDSGICVHALNDAPGIYSARFAGANATDASNNQKLLHDLEGVKERSAYFICALHLSIPKHQAMTAEGRVEGSILACLTGDTGFGYDPLFFSPELNKTFAQATAQEKASVSHRGRALRMLQTNLTPPQQSTMARCNTLKFNYGDIKHAQNYTTRNSWSACSTRAGADQRARYWWLLYVRFQ